MEYLLCIDYRLLAIASAFFGAIGNILARTILKKEQTRDILGLNFLIMTTTLAVFSPWFFKLDLSVKTLDIVPQSILLVLLIAAIDFVANYFFFKSFEKSSASAVTPILSLTPGFVFIFGWLILDEKTDPNQFILAGIIILGIVVVSIDFRKADPQNVTREGLYSALVASLLFAISAVPTKYILVNGLVNAASLYLIRAGLIGLFAILWFNRGIIKPKASQLGPLFIRSLFVLAQWLLLYTALRNGNLGITYALASITPIFVLLFGISALKEEISCWKIVAAIMVLFLALVVYILK